MGRRTLQILTASLFWVGSVGVPACSAAPNNSEGEATESHLTEEMQAVLSEVPGETVTRFILTIELDNEGEVAQQRVDAIQDRLHESGATTEWLEGTPVLFVTGDKAAIYDVIETGYIAAVQVDQLRKPMD
jgi:hypothetical protein